MKRAGNLFERWCNHENFYLAYYEIRKGKTFFPSFIRFENNIAFEIESLINEIRQGCYKTKPYRNFKIHEPKERTISAPHIRDRLVQHALMRVINPIFDRKFIHHTYACRKNRGTHSCSLKLVSYLKKFKDDDYCLKIDISKFFYSISKKILYEKVQKFIKCKATLEVIKEFIDNTAFYNANETGVVFKDESDVGIPIGNLTSQMLANLMLSDLDHFIKRVLKCKYYLRYMDDIIVLDNNKDKLHYIFRQIELFIEKEGLKINRKSNIFNLKQGVDFVGYRTWKHKRLIRKQSLFRVRKTLKKGFNKNRVSSYLAHAKDTNSLHYVHKTINQYEVIR